MISWRPDLTNYPVSKLIFQFSNTRGVTSTCTVRQIKTFKNEFAQKYGVFFFFALLLCVPVPRDMFLVVRTLRPRHHCARGDYHCITATAALLMSVILLKLLFYVLEKSLYIYIYIYLHTNIPSQFYSFFFYWLRVFVSRKLDWVYVRKRVGRLL